MRIRPVAIVLVVVVLLFAALALAGCGANRGTEAHRVSGVGTVASGSGRALASCPPAVRGLGLIAITAEGRLELVDLASCQELQLATGVAEGVRFSPDGRWLAYSRLVGGEPVGPVVMPVSGGAASQPLGAGVVSWSWAPKRDLLYGVNGHDQLVAGSPGRRPRILASWVGERYAWSPTAAPSPNGRLIAVDRSRCGNSSQSELDTVAVPSGARRIVLMQPGGQATFAGWSPDGRWLLYWAGGDCAASVTADGLPLEAVPAGGGGPVTAVAHMLLYPDFLTWCGQQLIAAAGPNRETQLDSTLVATAPPSWPQRTIEPARKLSWVSPACAPSGRLLAASAGPNTENPGFGDEHRSIWLLRPDGTAIRKLTSPPARELSDEAPRFSRNGRWILFVRSQVLPVGESAIARDTLELVPAAITGTASAVPIVAFTSNDFSYYDHFEWPSEIDWYQPATAPARRAVVHAARPAATRGADGWVAAGRAYLGTVRRSRVRDINGGPKDPIDLDVSRDGRTATVIAAYQSCRRGAIYYPELSFPATNIVEDHFDASYQFVEKSRALYARVSVTGTFLSGQRVGGTISSATNVSARTGRPGGVCRTSNHWQASEGPRGFSVCTPHPLGDLGVAQDIYADRAPCPAVQRALKRGAFTPATLPLAPAATFTTPHWSCHATPTVTRSWACTRGQQGFHFVVWS